MVDPKTLTVAERHTRTFLDGGRWYDPGPLVDHMTVRQREDLMLRITQACLDVLAVPTQSLPTPKAAHALPMTWRVIEGGRPGA
jgi:hypothetical protein